MSASTNIPQSHVQPSNTTRWISWVRCFLLFIALSSGSLLNTRDRAVAASNHAASTRIAITGLACECVSAVEPTATSSDGSTTDVIRIDEDWELVVTEPDANLAAPQIQTVMSPFQNMDGFFICFLVNHRNNPDVAVGGLEVQFWYGDYQLGAQRLDEQVLQLSNETITWTQRLMIKTNGYGGNYLCFRVVDGQSESWGPFGGTEPLHMNIDTSNTSLSGYSSVFSIANSGVFFSSNRVARLVLKAVRGYSADGTLVFEESSPVVVFDGSSQQN